MVVEQAKEKAKDAIKEAAKKIIKRFGWGFILEWTPFIGFLIPGDIILVWRTLGGINGSLVSPEGALMIPIALFAYVLKLILGIIEIWFDLGIFTTLITWAIAAFFVVWIFVRGYALPDTNKEQTPKTTAEKKELPTTGGQKNAAAPKTPPKMPSVKK